MVVVTEHQNCKLEIQSECRKSALRTDAESRSVGGRERKKDATVSRAVRAFFVRFVHHTPANTTFQRFIHSKSRSESSDEFFYERGISSTRQEMMYGQKKNVKRRRRGESFFSLMPK